ncbi:Mal regulon transcriptional regulator MalI [Salmonella enterica]|uniref:Mal regulon transcriptional regulator MalI n=2 Tax=Salmonella enterica TaxID=28901 RepID=UPI0009AE5B79|nr:Mal regulon transcriptional regulator MalI [Salmonella enterica]EDT2776551.1 Mal regulon transcriptional regulator MalI [Salmonella enterica subsp. enterica]EAM7545479.1 Mal regulon transcriptional regulator MalI [Salmonella enterica]EAO6611749.1 Mal regulon transcriptional regulator MalI [Salmonella enterica]EAP9181213.1 Mal regulon transcriptional regulator MalI [Salmonella enterica]EAU3387142.1 Mal regulon transcriptional regulator MalI [Salmonella enterica]
MAIAKKITIHDVALAAGVSVSTVSLVLSGKGRISAATGERVNAAIEQLGFVRNRQASALRGGQSGVIGLIVRDLSAPFYAELTAGLTEALEAQGRMVFLLHGGKDGEQLNQRFTMLLNQGVDGMVIAGAAGSSEVLRAQADAQGIPVVFASRASYLDDADTVRPDNMQAVQLLTEYLIRQGHQRIAWLGGQSASLTRAERVGGYCATLLKYGLPFHSEWVVECASSQKQAAESITALLRYNPTISAVVCYNETIAMGAWFGLLRAGRQSGESGVDRYFEQQVSLAAFADVAENALDDLPIIWASTPAREIGYTLAERILQRIAHDEHHVRSQTIAARLVTQK